MYNKKDDKKLINGNNSVSEGAAANAAAPSSVDIDGDGKTTASDSRLIWRYVNGYDDNLTDAQKGMLDFNNDGTVSDNDAVGALHVAAKLPTQPFVSTPSLDNKSENKTEEQSEVDLLIEQYLNEYKAIKDFSYDPNNPLAQYYDRTFKNAALLNQQNALAAGGTGYSSTKQALANSAYNSTIGELGNVQQQLYQIAKDEYQQKRADALNNIELARALKQDKLNEDYQKWTIENTEKEQERNQANIEAERTQQNAALAAQYGVYGPMSELTGVDFSSAEKRLAFDDAYQLYTATGDMSGFEELGVDTSKLTQDSLKEFALLKASVGDYSGLEAMGIDTTSLTKENNMQIALSLAQFGSYDMLENILGADLSDAKYANKLEIGLAAAQAGDYSKLEEMGFDTSFIKKINDKQLSTGSSGGSGGGTTKVQTITQKNIDDAIDAFNIGGESNLNAYLNQLYNQGYSEEQLYFIVEKISEEIYQEEDLLNPAVGTPSFDKLREGMLRFSNRVKDALSY